MSTNKNQAVKKRSFTEDEDGVAAIEFAIISLLFLAVLFAIVEASRVVWAQNTLTYALEEAARERLVDNDLTNAEVEAIVISRMENLIDTSTVDITITTTTTASGIDMISVEGTIDYIMLMPILPDAISTFELSAETHMPLSS